MRDARLVEPANGYEAWLRDFDLRDINAADPRSMWALKYRSRLERILAALEALPPGARVLEVGSAQANASLLAAERGMGALALDREPRALAYALKKHERGDFMVVCADAQHLPLADETFDGVLAPELLEHLDGPAAALREMRRVLRPEGLLVVTTPNDDYERRRPPAHRRPGDFAGDAAGHVRSFTLQQLCQLVQECGFRLTHSGYEGSVLMSDRLGLNRLLPPQMITRLSRWVNGVPGAGRYSYNCFLTAIRL